MANRINTVNGIITQDELGFTLSHEHTVQTLFTCMPNLVKFGVDEAVANKLMIDNPARILAY